jgi:hypothetical protein
MYNEALGFVIEYLALYPHTRCRIWDANEKETNVRENLSGNGVVKMLSSMEMEMTHVSMLYQTLWSHRHSTSTIEITCSILCLLSNRLIRIKHIHQM